MTRISTFCSKRCVEVPGRSVVRKGLEDLLGGPLSGGRGRDVEVQDAAPIVGHDQQHVGQDGRTQFDRPTTPALRCMETTPTL